MRKLKKWSCLLLALLMLSALAACVKKQQPDSDASQNEVQDTDTPQDLSLIHIYLLHTDHEGWKMPNQK